MEKDFVTLGKINKLYAYVVDSAYTAKLAIIQSMELNDDSAYKVSFEKAKAYKDIKKYMEELFNDIL
jgi:hypothetical protein